MNPGEVVGTLGVMLLLFAFAMNLAKKWTATSRAYLWLNSVGAAMTCVSSYMIRFWPFVILEGVWTLSSLVVLIRTKHE